MNIIYRFINKIILTLIISDFFLNLGWGFIAPIFAIFIVGNIASGGVAQAAEIAGFSALIYWTVKSILQIPIARSLDRNHGEVDDYWYMVVGTLLLGLVPIGYLFSTQPWHIYLCQAFNAVAAALIFPSWSAIFTRHIDKGREAMEWSLHSTVLGFGVGIAGGIGGLAVALVGFKAVFIFVSAFTIISGLLLLIVRNDISPINKPVVRTPGKKRTLTEL